MTLVLVDGDLIIRTTEATQMILDKILVGLVQWKPFLHFISYLLSGKLSASCFKNRSLVFFSIPSEFVFHRFYILEIKIFLMPDKSLFYDSL